jgi:hypothetical protein
MKKINYMVLFALSTLLLACSSDVKIDKLIGQWKVSDMKVDLPNVPPQLIQNAKTLALSSTYEFKLDMTYCMTISKNELEDGRKQIGSVILNSNNISLHTDSLMFEVDGIWTPVKMDDFFKSVYKTMELKVEKITMNQLLISEKEGTGTIYYTLDRIK